MKVTTYQTYSRRNRVINLNSSITFNEIQFITKDFPRAAGWRGTLDPNGITSELYQAFQEKK